MASSRVICATGSSTCRGPRRWSDGEGADLAALLVEFGAEVLLRLVILSGGYDDRILDRSDHDLRIDALFAAESVDYVVQFTRHKFVPP